jgi:hypothetical protein
MAAITNTVTSDPNTLNKFNEIKNRVKKDLGYTNYDAQGQATIERAINTGLFVGLDKPVKTLIEDRNFTTPQLSETQRQFNLELNLKGYNKDGTIDKDNPYWKARDLEWDDENKEWKVGKKPGVDNTRNNSKVTRTKHTVILNYKGEVVEQGPDAIPEGAIVNYNDLSPEDKAIVDKINKGDIDGYDYYKKDPSLNSHSSISVVPRITTTTNNEEGNHNDV